MKAESRILGIDDGPFDKFKKGSVLVVGAVFRGGKYPDAILSTTVKVDGDDATEKIIKMVKQCRQKSQLHAILLKGIALGGFNVVNIEQVARKTGIPVIVVIRDYPDLNKIEKILIGKVTNGKKKFETIKRAGVPEPISVKGKTLYMQFAGISKEKAEDIVKSTSLHSFIPEPIRLAHMVAAGIVLGRSRSRV